MQTGIEALHRSITRVSQYVDSGGVTMGWKLLWEVQQYIVEERQQLNAIGPPHPPNQHLSSTQKNPTVRVQ